MTGRAVYTQPVVKLRRVPEFPAAVGVARDIRHIGKACPDAEVVPHAAQIVHDGAELAGAERLEPVPMLHDHLHISQLSRLFQQADELLAVEGTRFVFAVHELVHLCSGENLNQECLRPHKHIDIFIFALCHEPDCLLGRHILLRSVLREYHDTCRKAQGDPGDPAIFVGDQRKDAREDVFIGYRSAAVQIGGQILQSALGHQRLHVKEGFQFHQDVRTLPVYELQLEIRQAAFWVFLDCDVAVRMGSVIG